MTTRRRTRGRPDPTPPPPPALNEPTAQTDYETANESDYEDPNIQASAQPQELEAPLEASARAASPDDTLQAPGAQTDTDNDTVIETIEYVDDDVQLRVNAAARLRRQEEIDTFFRHVMAEPKSTEAQEAFRNQCSSNNGAEHSGQEKGNRDSSPPRRRSARPVRSSAGSPARAVEQGEPNASRREETARKVRTNGRNYCNECKEVGCPEYYRAATSAAEEEEQAPEQPVRRLLLDACREGRAEVIGPRSRTSLVGTEHARRSTTGLVVKARPPRAAATVSTAPARESESEPPELVNTDGEPEPVPEEPTVRTIRYAQPAVTTETHFQEKGFRWKPPTNPQPGQQENALAALRVFLDGMCAGPITQQGQGEPATQPPRDDTQARRKELAKLNEYPRTPYPDTDTEEEMCRDINDPPRAELDNCRQDFRERRTAAEREYQRHGRVLIRHRAYQDERRYIDEQYMSSDTTDADSDYSTTQEDSDAVEARYAGITHPGQSDDKRYWPRRKLRRANKHIRQRRRTMGLTSLPYCGKDDVAPFKPIKTAARLAGARRPNSSERREKMTWHFDMMKGATSYARRFMADIGALDPSQGVTRRHHVAEELEASAGPTGPARWAVIESLAVDMSNRRAHRLRTGRQQRHRRTREEWEAQQIQRNARDRLSAAEHQPMECFEQPHLTEPLTAATTGSQNPTRGEASTNRPGGLTQPLAGQSTGAVSTTILPGVTLSAANVEGSTGATPSGSATIRVIHEHPNRNGSSSDGGTSGIYGSRDFRLPTFKGRNWISFLNKFERIAEARRWDDEAKAVALYNAIESDAAEALGEKESVHWTYDRLVAHMERRHGRNKTWGDILPAARNMYRKPGQSLASFYDQVINLLNQGNLDEGHFKVQAYQTFLNGLQCSKRMLNEIMPQVREYTIRELCDLAEAYEALHGATYNGGQMPVQVNMVGSADDYEDAAPNQCGTQTYVSAATTTVQPPPANNPTNGAGQPPATLDGLAASLSTVSDKLDYMQGQTDRRFDMFDRRIRNIEGRPPPDGEYNRGNGGNRQRGGGQGRGGGYRQPYRNNQNYQRGGYGQQQNQGQFQQQPNQGPYPAQQQQPPPQPQDNGGRAPPNNPYHQQGLPSHQIPVMQAPVQASPNSYHSASIGAPDAQPPRVSSSADGRRSQDARQVQVNHTSVQGGGQSRRD